MSFRKPYDPPSTFTCVSPNKVVGNVLTFENNPVDDPHQVVLSNFGFSSLKTYIPYFEIRVTSLPPDSVIGIGLAFGYQPLSGMMPGWKGSYGYHSDDGKFFSDSSIGVPYASTWKENDVVGCGVNNRRQLFFTLNGKFLGVAKENVSPNRLYPMGIHPYEQVTELTLLQVGAKHTASLQFNFGQEEFVYDISGMFISRKYDPEYFNPSQTVTIADVPLPLLKIIIESALNSKSASVISRVCKKWNEIATSSEIWDRLKCDAIIAEEIRQEQEMMRRREMEMMERRKDILRFEPRFD